VSERESLIAARWLSHPVVLVDAPEDEGVEDSWIEATEAITAENAAEKFTGQLPDAVEGRRAIAVTGPCWHVAYHPDYDEGETPVPLDYESENHYFCERAWWSQILLPADNAVPFWRIEWSEVA